MSTTGPTGTKAPRAPHPSASRQRTTHYLVTLWGCVEPALEGPFAADGERVEAARAWKRDGNWFGGVLRLDIDANGTPHVSSFGDNELSEDGDDE